VNPLAGGHRGLGHDLERRSRPEKVQAESHPTVFEQQFVAAAAGIGRCLRVVDDDGAESRDDRRRRRLEPEAERKRIRALEMPDLGKREAIFTIELSGSAAGAGDEARGLVGLAGFRGVDRFSGLTYISFIFSLSIIFCYFLILFFFVLFSLDLVNFL
jgi:hypothetical protein